MRKTKIVATLGPSSNDVEQLKALIEAGIQLVSTEGVNAFSLRKVAAARINNFKQAREELGKPVPIVLDTKGPEIRIKTFATKKVSLVAGQEFTLTTDDIEGDNTKVAVTYMDLPNDVKIGSTVLIDDGLVGLTVVDIKGSDVICTVNNSAELGSRKGVNLPDIHINLPALTEKDIDDIKFGVEMGIDYIAASFIRSAKDVLEIKRVLEECGGSDVHIISKIENRDGVDNIDEILEVTDGIMVARGDLGVEIPFEEVPLVQKLLIKKCIEKGKPVITATQMLNSMIENPRPTRAEVNDVANAIFDYTDAVMLSGETANGSYPVEAVKAMARIAEKTEQSIDYIERFNASRIKTTGARNITSAVSHSACTTAQDLNASLISTITISGRAVKDVAKYRPSTPILACTPNERTLRQLNLIWGCTPMYIGLEKKSINALFDDIAEKSLVEGISKNGDLMVFTGGTPLGTTGSTNTIKVGIVGNTLLQGKAVVKSVVSHTNVIHTVGEAKLQFRKGDVFITSNTDKGLIPYMMKAAAIVVGNTEGDEFTHAADLGRELKIPVILCKGIDVAATIPDTLLVQIDSNKATVSLADR